LLVGNDFEHKNKKVGKNEFEHCHQDILNHFWTVLTNLSIFTKRVKRSKKNCNFDKPKLPKKNHVIIIMKKKVYMLVILFIVGINCDDETYKFTRIKGNNCL